jgi:ribonuclease T1
MSCFSPNRRRSTFFAFASYRIAALFALTLNLVCLGAFARASDPGTPPAGDLPIVAVADLPKQARETLALIRQGGPFPFPKKDGSTFGNRERLLPKQARGYYKEYTVITPGSRDRGARRIVCGGDVSAPSRSICFYTADHYATFKRIKES